MIPGLKYYPDVVSPENETALLTYLDSNYLTWDTTLNRRTQQFGYTYSYNGGKLTLTQPISGPILQLAEFLISQGIFAPGARLQCIVNEYTRNQGIAPHIDAPLFGPTVVSFSLGADAVMDFANKITGQSTSLLLARGSLLVLTGPARSEWTHGLDKRVTYNVNDVKITKPQNYRRVSLTFRTVI